MINKLQFECSKQKINRIQRIICMSNTEHQAYRRLFNLGYTGIFNRRCLDFYSDLVGDKDYTKATHYTTTTNWWDIIPP